MDSFRPKVQAAEENAPEESDSADGNETPSKGRGKRTAVRFDTALGDLKAKLGEMQKVLAALSREHRRITRPSLSVAARRRIAEAQRQRWAKIRKEAAKLRR